MDIQTKAVRELSESEEPRPNEVVVRVGEEFVHRGTTFRFVGATDDGFIVVPLDKPRGSRKLRRLMEKSARKRR